MGMWNISIHGTGAHHNPDNPGDADRLMEKIVQMLKDAGHYIEYAAFGHGGRDTMHSVTSTPTPDAPAQEGQKDG